MHYDINENLTPQEIEFWEQQYLEQIFYSLNLDKDKMLSGFNTKEEIREDWEAYLGDQTSDFATGSERIFTGFLINLGNLILHQLDQICSLKLTMLMCI